MNLQITTNGDNKKQNAFRNELYSVMFRFLWILKMKTKDDLNENKATD